MLHGCRIIPTTTATIIKAEDSEGRIWAMKRIQSDSQSIREAERLVKLRSHPLVVPLRSIFVDHEVTFLQMPFYANGNLRRWVEQVKVRHPLLHELTLSSWSGSVPAHETTCSSFSRLSRCK